ncbi:hypothetical protein JW921_09340 [Candidatus Fermentibacterales bacterium]|nr:hypothetical protein [Candidatus Fermentibacterales bacterium]
MIAGLLPVVLLLTGQTFAGLQLDSRKPAASEEQEPPASFRLGMGMGVSFVDMADEEALEEEFMQAGVGYDLDYPAWGFDIEVLGNISDRFRGRLGLTMNTVSGAYQEASASWEYIWLGLFTGGLAFLFGPPSTDVIDMSDMCISVEATGFYRLGGSDAVGFYLGAGPTYNSISRELRSPDTGVKGGGSSFGVLGALRLDQERTHRLLGCIPILLGVEAGYRYCPVEIDDEEAEGFTVDFSGPYIRVGNYIGL